METNFVLSFSLSLLSFLSLFLFSYSLRTPPPPSTPLTGASGTLGPDVCRDRSDPGGGWTRSRGREWARGESVGKVEKEKRGWWRGRRTCSDLPLPETDLSSSPTFRRKGLRRGRRPLVNLFNDVRSKGPNPFTPLGVGVPRQLSLGKERRDRGAIFSLVLTARTGLTPLLSAQRIGPEEGLSS